MAPLYHSVPTADYRGGTSNERSPPNGGVASFEAGVIASSRRAVEKSAGSTGVQPVAPPAYVDWPSAPFSDRRSAGGLVEAGSVAVEVELRLINIPMS
jgi:hypothetical protein